MQSKAAQRAYRELIEKITAKVLASEFENSTHLAKVYSRPRSFVSKAKRAAIRFNLCTAEEWRAGFTAPGRREQYWKCPSCAHRWKSNSKFLAQATPEPVTSDKPEDSGRSLNFLDEGKQPETL